MTVEQWHRIHLAVGAIVWLTAMVAVDYLCDRVARKRPAGIAVERNWLDRIARKAVGYALIFVAVLVVGYAGAEFNVPTWIGYYAVMFVVIAGVSATEKLIG